MPPSPFTHRERETKEQPIKDDVPSVYYTVSKLAKKRDQEVIHVSLPLRLSGKISRRQFFKGSVGASAALGLSACAGNDGQSERSQEAQQETTSASGKVAIIHTNDTHGHDLLDEESLGFAAVAQLKSDWEAKGYEVLLFDVGDAAQGDNLVDRSKGDAAIEFMNKVGYNAMTLGNHEFDFGQDKITDYVAAATFPIVSANITVDATGERLVDPSCVITLRDGRKVGVFGLTTPETYTKSNPLLVNGLAFAQGEELYACAQEQVDDLKGKGCDLVICLGHLGESDGSAPNRAQDVVTNVSGIDLFIDGHDHLEEGQSLKDASGGETLMVEAECYTHMIGVVTWEDGRLEQQLVKFGEYDGQDATVAAAVQEVSDEINKDLRVVVGTTPFLLNGERSPGVRTQETNLGDFVADAVLWEAQQSAEDTPQCAVVNGGGIRRSIDAGDIKLGDVLEVAPFLNYICTIKVSGSQLLEAFEASCFATPGEIGGFPQVSGIEYSIDTTVPFEEGDLYPDSTFHAPAKPGSRVTIQSVDGAPFDESATYTVATLDFMCAGGDTYYVFAETAQTTMKSTGYLMQDALRYYLEEACGGEVGNQYAEPQGRIKIVTT